MIYFIILLLRCYAFAKEVFFVQTALNKNTAHRSIFSAVYKFVSIILPNKFSRQSLRAALHKYGIHPFQLKWIGYSWYVAW